MYFLKKVGIVFKDQTIVVLNTFEFEVSTSLIISVKV